MCRLKSLNFRAKLLGRCLVFEVHVQEAGQGHHLRPAACGFDGHATSQSRGSCRDSIWFKYSTQELPVLLLSVVSVEVH